MVAEHLEVVDAEFPAGLLEFDSPDGDDLGLVVALLAWLHPARAVAQLTVGARDDHGADALGGGPGQDAAGADGLVVRVGVDGHEREGSAGGGHGTWMLALHRAYVRDPGLSSWPRSDWVRSGNDWDRFATNRLKRTFRHPRRGVMLEATKLSRS